MGEEVEADLDEERAPIAGFWRRTAAFGVDGIVLGVVGWVFAFFAYDGLVAMGGWALLIGFVIAVAYFALLDGPLAPSPGKQLLELRVVDRQGRPLSIGRAAVRALVVAIPYFLNGAPLPAMLTTNPVAGVLQTLIVFGAGFVILYLMVFNRTTRQSLHDLATGTYVVEGTRTGMVPAALDMPRLHAVVAGGWLALVGLALTALWVRSLGVPKRGELVARLNAVQAAVLAQPEVARAAVVQDGAPPDTDRPRWYSVTAFVREWPEDRERFALDVVQGVRWAGWQCEGDQWLVVRVVRGFSMGIANGSKSETFRYTCAEWAAKASGG